MLVQSEPSKRPGASRGKPNLKVLQARMRAGMSREGLGDAAGISAKQVGLIERGVARHSRPETLAGIAAALDADVFDLFPERKRPVARKPRTTKAPA